MNYENLITIAEKAMNEAMFPPPAIELPMWNKFNELTGGFRKHELTLMTAPTGAGKTQWMANLSMQLMIKKIPQFVASVETGPTDFMRRIFSAFSRKDFNSGKPVDQKEALELLTGPLKGLLIENRIQFAVYEDRVTAEEMIETLAHAHEKKGVEIAILDNLNFFLKVVSTNYEKAEMDDAIHRFVMMAKKLPIHILLIVHPKKTTDGRVMSEFDIKGSSTAVQEASNVFLLNRPDKEALAMGNKYQDRELQFAKLRKRGENVGHKLYFGFEKGCYYEL